MMQKLKKTPKLVVELFRHGARGPLKSDDAYWTGLEGKLTTLGKAQHYILGASMMQRYPHLIQNISQGERLYLRTTEFTRTRQSLEYHLLGMHGAHHIATDGLSIYNINFSRAIKDHKIYESFLNIEKQNIKHLDSQIVTVPFEDDLEMLCTELKACPNSHQLLGDDNLKLLENHLAPMMERIMQELSMKLTPQDLRYTYDYFLAQEFEGRELPEKLTKKFWAEMKLAGEYFLVFKRFGNEVQRKLFAICLSEMIVETLKGGVEGSYPHDLVLLSAHDVTVFNILNMLDILTPGHMLSKLQDNKLEIHEFPNFASQLLFELWETEDNNSKFVKVIYENKILKFGKTGEEFISLQRFEEILKAFYAPYTREDVYHMCGCTKYVNQAKKQFA